MDRKQAGQIAELLNTRNQLTKLYNANRILKSADDYEFLLDDNEKVIAAVMIKKVQWYQWEICHLSVSEAFERQGFGTKLINKAEIKAKKGGARIIQCTIRENNIPSKAIFGKSGFRHVATFYYPLSRNNVEVWQKVISC